MTSDILPTSVVKSSLNPIDTLRPPGLEDLDPATAALLVIDAQNAFLHPDGTLGAAGVDLSGAPAAIARMRALVELCESAGMPVVWTRQEHLAADASREAKVLAPHTARRGRVAALAGTWDAELVDELAPLAGDPARVVVKHRFGCFHATRLEPLLAASGTRTLLVAGATANACVDTTLREAYMRDFDLVAVTDCITAVRPDWERAAHEIWGHYLAELATLADVGAWLAGRGAITTTRAVSKEGP